jgi:hypothetical protein
VCLYETSAFVSFNLLFIVKYNLIVLCKVICGTELLFIEQFYKGIAGKRNLSKLHQTLQVAVGEAGAVAYDETASGMAVFQRTQTMAALTLKGAVDVIECIPTFLPNLPHICCLS